MNRCGQGGLVLLLSATQLIGCLSVRVGEPGPSIVDGRPRPIADRVVLQVDETGVLWSHGRMGEVMQQALLELGSFREVYYPVEPSNPPPLRISIEAVGRVSEDYAVAFGKVLLTTVLAYLPIGIVMFHRDFALEARATFWRNGTLLQQMDLATTARMSAPIVRDRKEAEKVLPEAMFRQLAEELAVRLVPVSTSLGSTLAAPVQRTR